VNPNSSLKEVYSFRMSSPNQKSIPGSSNDDDLSLRPPETFDEVQNSAVDASTSMNIDEGKSSSESRTSVIHGNQSVAQPKSNYLNLYDCHEIHKFITKRNER